MDEKSRGFFHSDVAILSMAAAVLFALHLATNGQYGFHRDELQTLDDARHLDWGFVAYPPITPLIGRLELILFGTSLIGFRVFAALAVSLVMLLTGLAAKELGGTRHAQVMAAVAAGLAPISLIQGAVFQYVSFDYLWGVTVTYLLVRLLKSQNPRWWLAIGAMIGLGMQTRYTIGVLALGVVAGVVLTPARRWLLNGWLWAGVGLSLLVFLPNFIWQARHHFVSREFLTYLHARDLRWGRYDGFWPEQLLVNVSLVTAPLVFVGLWFFFVHREGRRYRLLGWVFVASLTIFGVVRSRSYYAAPLYPILLAGGSVLLASWMANARPLWSRLVYGLQWTTLIGNGVVWALLALPVAPIGSPIWKITAKVYDQFREEIGWSDLARAVAGVYQSLPAEERERTGILTGNYGEAGALNLYGAPLGLPHAMGLTNSFWYRGYDPRLPTTVIVTGFELEDGQRLFESCAIAAKNTNPFGVENEESHFHPDILLCRGLRVSWPEYWASHRRFG